MPGENYRDYFTGKWDGKPHEEEEREVLRNGSGKGIPYIVPTDNYITYFKTVRKKVVDAAITTIYPEGPEFWARGGCPVKTFPLVEMEANIVFHGPFPSERGLGVRLMV